MQQTDISVKMYDSFEERWLSFEQPLEIIQAAQVSEVLPALARLENRIQEANLYAAGFISYEAASAFNPVYQCAPPGEFPLLWFGLYAAPKVIPAPQPAQIQTAQLGKWISSQSREDYGRSIDRIKDWIAAGHTYQVNYTLRMHASFQGDPWDVFAQLWHKQPVKYAAYLDIGRYTICSASPELFFKLEGENLTCKPMKGTAPRGVNLLDDQAQSNWLAGSEKNRAENVMILDMLRNDLGRIAEYGSVQTKRLFEVERYATLWQMTSTVQAASRASLAGIFQALFPCASITGAPKVRTMEIIHDLEPTPRQIYTGCIGFITPQRKAQFNVAIRTILFDRSTGTAEYGVGGGIVWDSTSDGEYEECQVKCRLLTQARPGFDLLESLLWTPENGFWLLDYHLDRLAASAEYFGFVFDRQALADQLRADSQGLPGEAHKARLTLNRAGKASTQFVALAGISVSPRARLTLAQRPVDSENVFLYHKTTWREVYEEARSACPSGTEPLLWNQRGELTESDTANLVVRHQGELFTPPLACGLLAGAFRAQLLETGQIRERVLPKAELPAYQEIFLINSVRGWRPAEWSRG